MAKHITLLLILAAVPLLQSSNPQVEADAELIRLAEERDRIFKNLDWNQTATKKQWVFFYTLQALDVYSTHRGLKYDCIKEGNPLLGDRPTVSHMITHKTIFLSPYWMLQNEGIFTQRDITFVNGVGTAVVFNNFRLLEKAKERCTKR
jgi:hypothetical protein